MTLVKTFDEYELCEKFKRYDRDHYSLEAYRAILEEFDTFEGNQELDVIDICCNYSEVSKSELIEQYDNYEDHIVALTGYDENDEPVFLIREF